MTSSRLREDRFWIVEVEAADVGRYPNGIEDMHAGVLGGILVRNALPADLVERAVARLERGDIQWDEAEYNVAYIGRPVAGSRPDLGDFFEHAARFRGICRELFAGELDVEVWLTEFLANLSGGRPTATPVGPGGEKYSATVLRRVSSGAPGLPLHCDSLLAGHRPEYEHLSTLLDLREQLTFILPLMTSDAGGEVVIHALEWSEVADRFAGLGERDPIPLIVKKLKEVFPDPDAFESLRISQRAGDLLVFNGSRIFHRVTPVTGSRPRISFGGGVSLSKERRDVYIWPH